MTSNRLSIPAQLLGQQGMVISVWIVSLSEALCNLRDELRVSPPEMFGELWIGAVGPLRVHVNTDHLDRLEFDGVIHPSIVAHFNA